MNIQAFYLTTCAGLPAAVFRSQDMWVAQSLTHYMVAQGANRTTTKGMLSWSLKAQAAVDIADGQTAYWNTQAGLTNIRECKE